MGKESAPKPIKVETKGKKGMQVSVEIKPGTNGQPGEVVGVQLTPATLAALEQLYNEHRNESED